MSSCRRLVGQSLLGLTVATLSLVASFGALAQASYPGVGRAATPKEVQAWDIDVRPDFKGLPKGSGSVAQGQDISGIKVTEGRLIEQVEELRRWQNVMLDREDRVRELKREVNEFCRRVGEAARYPSQEDAAAEPRETQMKQEHKR